MDKKKIIIAASAVVVIAAAVAAIFLLGGEKEAPIPESYSVFGREYPAMTTEKAPETQKEDGEKDEEASKEDEEPEDEPKSEKEEWVEAQEKALPETYHYTGITEPQTIANAYAKKLTEEYGFECVDEELRKAELPKTEEAAGEIYLAYKMADPKEILKTHLTWDDQNCTVTFAVVEGEIQQEQTLMSSMEVMDYIKSLPPKKLGLEGDSMENYNVYTLDGGVLVDGEPCIRVNIYRPMDDIGTNEIAGCYFISSIGKRIYRQDIETKKIVELKDAVAAS